MELLSLRFIFSRKHVALLESMSSSSSSSLEEEEEEEEEEVNADIGSDDGVVVAKVVTTSHLSAC